ncbi:hypothetical protein HMPREF1051_3000 [Neisseria sicca VK64]|uniref:Uncharacterized protein n=1 Tax=Neisseria sicca VK64 TaxID=1095748 RepID=I2NGC9_NEISI|nr:hypothetical protein HMPREF1051_3000 [Neisseria sicca VK64]
MANRHAAVIPYLNSCYIYQLCQTKRSSENLESGFSDDLLS